jgi:hypothetical protein
MINDKMKKEFILALSVFGIIDLSVQIARYGRRWQKRNILHGSGIITRLFAFKFFE